MNLLKSSALFLWMLGSSAWLCLCYLRMQRHKKHEKKPKTKRIEMNLETNEKTQLLEEWEDQIWEHTSIDNL